MEVKNRGCGCDISAFYPSPPSPIEYLSLMDSSSAVCAHAQPRATLPGPGKVLTTLRREQSSVSDLEQNCKITHCPTALIRTALTPLGP
eukprot:scaffold11543_cov128-Isochrysis_galbana.AAC.7